MRGNRPFSLFTGVVILIVLGALGCDLLPIPGAEPEIQFAAREEIIESGECTYLEWEVQGAEGYPVFLDGEQVGASGSESVCPEETTMYELVVGAPGGPHEERVVVQVKGGPGPAPTTAPPVATATQVAPTPTPVPPTSAPASSPTPAPIVNQTTHGRITGDEIWRGEIHVIGDVIVEEGATLTIEPGTVVRVAANQDVENLMDWPFDLKQGVNTEDTYEGGVHFGEPYRDEGHHISIVVNGTLHAVGTPEQMITITSDSPTPGVYDWNHFGMAHGILSYTTVEYYRTFDPGDGTEVSHCILRQVGECAVCANSSVVIEHNTISYAGHELIDMHQSSPVVRNNHLGPSPGHAALTIDGGSPQIVNNVIEGCGQGIHFISPPGNSNIEGNTFLNNGEDTRSDY
ncbi:MAG: right-handed parallel beta-helix repeat-containing protein [Anaerolineae bacterium]|nr:right-handed parallel beta-helix repeat-containing protein [Anaerolineae bacterium]